MATRRSSKYPTLKQWKAHPIRSWKRAARKIDRGRAEWLKERREIKEDRAKSRLLRDQEIAKKKQARQDKRIAADKARKARIDAAQTRRTQQAQPTVRTVPARTAATQRRTTPAEASLCGAPTDDGTPCQNPTTGGPCSAGHNPKAAGTVRVHHSKTARRRGETHEQFLHRGRSEAAWAAAADRQKAAAAGDRAWWRRA